MVRQFVGADTKTTVPFCLLLFNKHSPNPPGQISTKYLVVRVVDMQQNIPNRRNP